MTEARGARTVEKTTRQKMRGVQKKMRKFTGRTVFNREIPPVFQTAAYVTYVDGFYVQQNTFF